MGHYRSEMLSDAELERDAVEFRRKQAMTDLLRRALSAAAPTHEDAALVEELTRRIAAVAIWA